ncbi:MAG TPA: hypothetical protein VMZ29_01035 [Candidatus Bathyarchaeia archaeon]|nr:hypothetical protein [Candidatus Bathyarchaeia archaeon]
MKKSILIPILAISLLAVAAGASVGLIYAFSPSSDSELEIVSVTTQSTTDEVTVVLRCEENTTGNQHQNQWKRNFAFMHQIQFNNSATNETMYQEQMQNQWRHRVQAGKNIMYQFHVEGLEHGQILQLRITYNNGKVLMYKFTVSS